MSTDYKIALDDEIWAFIERTNSFYPPETATYPVEKQREIYNRMCADFRASLPSNITFEDRTIAGVRCRSYTPEMTRRDHVIAIYLHGGGFVVGGLESHHDICAELAAEAGITLIAVDYRLAPEHQFPNDIEDVKTVYDALKKENKIILIGDSAGGTLASSLAHMERGNPSILGQILIYPGLTFSGDLPSMKRHANAPMLSADDVKFYHDIRGENQTGDIRACALYDDDFSGICPTFIFSAECDPLADGGVIYAQRLNNAGSFAVNSLDIGLVHGHLRARHMSKRAKSVFDTVTSRVKQCAQIG